MLTSRFHSDNKIAEPATCSEFASGIVITKGENWLVYFNKATLPRINPVYKNPNTYPYGWTADIAKYSHWLGLNPIDINQHTEIKEAFIYSTIYNPCVGTILNWYAKTIYANTNSHHLKWLASQSTIKVDDIKQCQGLTGLYRKIDKLSGQDFHTQKGLHITVPEQKWINWKTMSPNSHSDFTQITWVQMNQFDQVTMMYALCKGQLGNKTIYLNFSKDAKHDDFWISELESMQNYVTKLAFHSGMYTQYNPLVYQELVYLNAPLKQTPYPNWNKELHPKFVNLPYSDLTMYWDDDNGGWYIDNMPTEWPPSMDENPCSKCSSHITPMLCPQGASSYPHESYSNGDLALSMPDENFPKSTHEIIEDYIRQTTCDPSYLYREPIDEFEAEDWDSRIN